jgi:hypothetical protein
MTVKELRKWLEHKDDNHEVIITFYHVQHHFIVPDGELYKGDKVLLINNNLDGNIEIHCTDR